MIDWTQAMQLRAEMADAFDELFEVFLSEIAEGLDRVDAAQGDADLGDALHFLKGAALNLGMSGFAERCALGEKAARAGRGASVDRQAVRAAFDAGRNALIEGLERNPA